MIAGLAGTHPLRGPNVDDFGVRFPPLSDAYDLGLRRQAHKSWKELSQKGRRRLHEGIYAFVGGPRRVSLSQKYNNRHCLWPIAMKPEQNVECCECLAQTLSACRQFPKL